MHNFQSQQFLAELVADLRGIRSEQVAIELLKGLFGRAYTQGRYDVVYRHPPPLPFEARQSIDITPLPALPDK